MSFNPYIFIPIWVGVMGVFAYSYEKSYTTKLVMGQEIRQINLFMAFITFLPIFLTAAFGDKIGDVWVYVDSFHRLEPSFSAIDWNAKGPGFQVLCVLIKMIFGDNETAYRVIIAIIHSIPIIILFRYYSSNYITTMFIFVATATYTAWMMNGLRQYVAAAIVYAATPWLLKKKYLRLILVILLASTVHNTVLVMLPIIFIVQGEAWNKKTLLFILGMIALIFVFSNTGTFDDAAESIGYVTTKELRETGDTGTSFLRVAVNAVPSVIALIYRKRLDKQNIILNVFINLSLVTTGLYLVSMVTSGILVGRVPAYTSMYNLILLPYLIHHCFEEDNRKIVNVAMIVLYLVYYFYQMHEVSGLI